MVEYIRTGKADALRYQAGKETQYPHTPLSGLERASCTHCTHHDHHNLAEKSALPKCGTSPRTIVHDAAAPIVVRLRCHMATYGSEDDKSSTCGAYID